RGVRFVFRTTPAGVINLANVRATRSTLVGSPSLTSLVATAAPSGTSTPSGATSPTLVPGAPTAAAAGSRAVALAGAVSVGNAVKSRGTPTDRTAVEIVLASGTPFLPRGELLELSAGGVVSQLSRHQGGNLGQVTFVIPKATFDALPDGQPLSVGYR